MLDLYSKLTEIGRKKQKPPRSGAAVMVSKILLLYGYRFSQISRLIYIATPH